MDNLGNRQARYQYDAYGNLNKLTENAYLPDLSGLLALLAQRA
jgi:hypothetical protein